MRMQVAVAGEIQGLKFSSDEARRIARFEFGRYAAHALMMPYASFLSAAQRAKYDIDVLRSRFGVSFEHAANRLTTLSRNGAAGVPFFMLEIDHAGKPLPPRRGSRVSPAALRRRLPQAHYPRFLRPAAAHFDRGGGNAGRGGISGASPARSKARMARSTSGQGARRFCWAATSRTRTRRSMAAPCRAPRKSAPPAACASGAAACRAPSRRSRGRWGWMRW